MIDVVCGVLCDREGRFLACKRPEGKHLAGLWEFPGGKVDSGESECEALVRELVEELGVQVEVGKVLEPVIWDYGGGPIRLVPFLCKIRQGVPFAHEHEELLWCEPERFGELEWAPADVPILKQLRELSESGAVPD